MMKPAAATLLESEYIVRDADSPGQTTLSASVANPEGSSASSYTTSQTPVISLPKGGGAIKGLGEKFAANPVSGAAVFTVPIATSPGRSSFGPSLTLTYDSGAGNGPFGFGWSLSLPSITRKTDKGLPRYFDAEESDVFMLSGVEDLVPVYTRDGARFEDTTTAPGYTIQRYRPRIESTFARIERWTRKDGDVHWRAFSRDNVLTLYGQDASSRIADPQDARRVFSWLICESRDDKGNAILYDYKRENGEGIDLAQVCERNRGAPNDIRRTANRYLKRIRYANRRPLLDGMGRRPLFLSDAQRQNAGWLFEVVFDYGEHDGAAPRPDDPGAWQMRVDPFSSYRAGFEIRTTRLCQRVLMFHHFPDEAAVGDNCLVRSTDFGYTGGQAVAGGGYPSYNFLHHVTQSGYRRMGDGYLKRDLPPVEFDYSIPRVQDAVEEIDAASLEQLPVGLDGVGYQWIDLHGEGIPGILSEHGGTWFYKRNLSPLTMASSNGQNRAAAMFGPGETVALRPNQQLAGVAQFMDLAGDGLPDLVIVDGPTPGIYEHDGAEGWQPFRPFAHRLNRRFDDPNLRLVDLDGDGHADVLISEHDALVWHPSLAEEGFGPAHRVEQARDEEHGPRLVFADGTQSIYLADMSGDGLVDLVRIRNGEVCYWPNLGYGRFGARVTMEFPGDSTRSACFDQPDQFDQRRIRLADIDGTGTTDIIYLHRDGARIYFNQSGNSLGAPQILRAFPRINDFAAIITADLRGNGTACLVWSSSLPGDTPHPIRYVDLMGGQKPHLLLGMKNNLGAETRVQYTPSTTFYLRDRREGQPWVTRLPFPVHVVERVETLDRITGNRFVTRYAYHHGYFDGVEREFRGFGKVEQWDSETFAALAADGTPLDDTNLAPAFHVPPVLTRTWFHTGAFEDEQRVARQYAHEYYREDDARRGPALDDTILPRTIRGEDGSQTAYSLTGEEVREACRALKGAILRQEIYGLDGTPAEGAPYAVSEHSYTIELLQPRGVGRHAVFFTHPRETVDCYYERAQVDVGDQRYADPRMSHTLTLDVDPFGNVLRTLAIGYRRRALPGVVAPEQQATHMTLTVSRVANRPAEQHWYRVGLPVETRTYEVVRPPEPAIVALSIEPFTFAAMEALASGLFPKNRNEPEAARLWPYEYWDWRANPANAPGDTRLRPLEHVRILYRRDDLTGPLELGEVESLALVADSYRLALTPGLLGYIFRRARGGQPAEHLLPNPAPLLEGMGGDGGGYSVIDGQWWISSGRVFYDSAANIANPAASAAAELAAARAHFFLPPLFVDPFGKRATVRYAYDLLIAEVRDALGSVVAATHDYRVLRPIQVVDANGNRTVASFDALGMVVATALIGKTGQDSGDRLDGVDPDPPLAALRGFIADPSGQAPTMLGGATTRFVYDLDRFRRAGQPPLSATLARETHVSDPAPQGLKIQVSFGYSDGFGRELQQKIPAERGNAPRRQTPEALPGGDIRPGALLRDANGQVMPGDAAPRWIGSGRTLYNNKGKPVKQYEPFFSATHLYEHERELTDTGAATIQFYDPIERVIATLQPNHTYTKAIYAAWRQESWDANDTILLDPRTDDDIGGYVRGYARMLPVDWRPWRARRIGGQLGAAERDAAQKAAAHAGTPSAAEFDALGRTFLTLAHNGFQPDGTPIRYPTRVELDIEGNQRAVADALGRIVMRYDYDMLGNRIHQASMEAGERWMLGDVMGKPLRAWDSRRASRRMVYDELRRPLELWVSQGNGPARMTERTIYGEGHPDAAANLRGRVFRIYDGAGVSTNVRYDFKGNLIIGSRRMARTYRDTIDWAPLGGLTDLARITAAAEPLLDPTPPFVQRTSYDALNRSTSVTTPDGSVYLPTFNDANLLIRVGVRQRGAAIPTPFVANIIYDARGQRESIAYANGMTTSYHYEPDTFRLAGVKTTRPGGANGLAAQIFRDSAVVQDLRYTYDPAGNITRVEDAALRTVFHDNQRVEAICGYVYDPLYRLTRAEGREHIGQNDPADNPLPGQRRDYPFLGVGANPNDLQALRNYAENYGYDPVGNLLALRHITNGGSWTREYAYLEASLLEPSRKSNRLSRTSIGAQSETYSYADSQGEDIHGCLTAINTRALIWDDRDQLRQVNLGGGSIAYYVYDAAGRRMRKIIERNGVKREERIYLGGFEIYRAYDGNGVTIRLARETLHVMDSSQRVALVETQTIKDAFSIPQPSPVARYQLANHLGSASLELDAAARLISYEEYHPYGTTSFQAQSAAEVSLKRYRYTGKERDEETGLSYHGARYYAPWLGRWVSCDPIGIGDGVNVYAYASQNPVRIVDMAGTDGSSVVPPVDMSDPKNIQEFDGAPVDDYWRYGIRPKVPSASLSGGGSKPAPAVKPAPAAKPASKPAASGGGAPLPQLPPPPPDHRFGFYPIKEAQENLKNEGKAAVRQGDYLEAALDFGMERAMQGLAMLEDLMPYNYPDHFLSAGQYAKRWIWYDMRGQSGRGLLELAKGHFEAASIVGSIQMGSAGLKMAGGALAAAAPEVAETALGNSSGATASTPGIAQRGEQIFNDLGAAMIKNPTEASPRWLRGRLTVSVVEPFGSGGMRIVTVQNERAHQLLASGQVPLLPNEVLGPAPMVLPEGEAWLMPAGKVHSEISGVWLARALGAEGGQVYTTNPACAGYCDPLFRLLTNWIHLNLRP